MSYDPLKERTGGTVILPSEDDTLSMTARSAIGVAIFLWIIAALLNLAASFNALAGVQYMSAWMENFSIMYLVVNLVSFSAVICVVLWILYADGKSRSWQFKQNCLWGLIAYGSVVILTVVYVAVYAFTKGDIPAGGSFCTATTCLMEPYTMFKSVFGILYIYNAYTAIIGLRFWSAYQCRGFVEIPVTDATRVREIIKQGRYSHM